MFTIRCKQWLKIFSRYVKNFLTLVAFSILTEFHFFFKVLDSLEDTNEDSSAGVGRSLEGIASGENLVGSSDASAEDNMQIFVVDDGNGGEMLLINTPEGQVAQDSG